MARPDDARLKGDTRSGRVDWHRPRRREGNDNRRPRERQGAQARSAMIRPHLEIPAPGGPERMRRTWRRATRAARAALKAGRALLDTRHPILVHVVPMRRCNLACAY